MKFGKIKDIDPEIPESYKDITFLTLDLDWAHDEIILDTIEILEQANVQATIFVTHETVLLDRLRKNDSIQLGIHPNFNPLLFESSSSRTSGDVINDIKNVVPDALAVRSHSMTQSSGLLKLFYESGLTHDCNHFVPYRTGIEMKPYFDWSGIVRVPYNWEDDVSALYGDNELFNDFLGSRYRVLDFHPMHIFLNTYSMELYENTREIHREPDKLRKCRDSSASGARSLLFELLARK